MALEFDPTLFDPAFFSNQVDVATGATFAEFVMWPDRQDVLLAILQPGDLLLTWTPGGAFINTYTTSFPKQVALADIPGGLPRTLEEVWEGSGDTLVKYVAVSSAALCNSTPGSYFWDISVGLLYVHTFDNVNPATKDAVIAYFNIYFSTLPIQLLVHGTVIPFAPMLEDTTAINTEQQAEDPLFGIKNIYQGNLTILNYNGFMSRMYAQYYWKNKRAEIYLGGSYNGKVLAFTDYQLLGTWLLTDVSPSDVVTGFKLVSQTSILQKQIPVTTYDPLVVPDADSGVKGSFMPLWYGRATVKPDLVDASVGTLGRYQLADPKYQTMFSIDSVHGINKNTGQTVGLLSTDYVFSLSNCSLTITNPAFAFNLFDIYVTATGKPDGKGSYINKWVDIAYDILVTFCGQDPVDDFDLVSLAAARVTAGAELSLYLKTPIDILSIFQNGGSTPSLERSVMARLDTTVDGRWKFQVMSQPTQFTNADLTLLQSDFVSFQPQPKLNSVFYKVVVLYDYDYGRQEWQSVAATSNRSRYANTTEDVVFIYTNLKKFNDANILAQRYRYLWSQIPLEIVAEEVSIKTLNTVIGAVASVFYAPAPTLTKKFTGDLFVVTGLKRDFSKPPKMTITLNNLRGAPGNVGFWSQTAGTPTWALSTPAQRKTQGYWLDPVGRAASNDATSVNMSIWW